MDAVLGVSANFEELIVNHPTCRAALAARSHQEYLSRLKWLALDCRDLLSAASKFIASVERKYDPTSVGGGSVSMGSTSTFESRLGWVPPAIPTTVTCGRSTSTGRFAIGGAGGF